MQNEKSMRVASHLHQLTIMAYPHTSLEIMTPNELKMCKDVMRSMLRLKF